MTNFHSLHQQALALVSELHGIEFKLIDLLQIIDSNQGFKEQGFTSLFTYVSIGLGLSEASAYQYITVSRKAAEVPKLKDAIESGVISVAKAKSICSVLDNNNVEDWLEKAKNCSTRELEKKVVESDPSQEKWKNISLPEETLKKLQRAQEIFAQKQGKFVRLEEVVDQLAEFFLEKEDVLRKPVGNPTLHVKSSYLTIGIKKQVLKRDSSKCQFKLPNGQKCLSGFWPHIHHIRPKCDGGSNEISNLITVCAGHHKILHRTDTFSIMASTSQ